SAITVDPPPMTRLIMIVPALFFVIGVTVDRVGRLFERVAGRLGLALGGVGLLAALAYAGSWNYRVFFVDAVRLLPSPCGTTAGRLARQAGPSVKTFVVGAPRLFFYSPNMRFLTRGLAGDDVTAADIPIRERGHRDALFIVLPEFQEALSRLRAAYPNGNF